MSLDDEAHGFIRQAKTSIGTIHTTVAYNHHVPKVLYKAQRVHATLRSETDMTAIRYRVRNHPGLHWRLFLRRTAHCNCCSAHCYCCSVHCNCCSVHCNCCSSDPRSGDAHPHIAPLLLRCAPQRLRLRLITHVVVQGIPVQHKDVARAEAPGTLHAQHGLEEVAHHGGRLFSAA